MLLLLLVVLLASLFLSMHCPLSSLVTLCLICLPPLSLPRLCLFFSHSVYSFYLTPGHQNPFTFTSSPQPCLLTTQFLNNLWILTADHHRFLSGHTSRGPFIQRTHHPMSVEPNGPCVLNIHQFFSPCVLKPSHALTPSVFHLFFLPSHLLFLCFSGTAILMCSHVLSLCSVSQAFSSHHAESLPQSLHRGTAGFDLNRKSQRKFKTFHCKLCFFRVWRIGNIVKGSLFVVPHLKLWN